MIDYEPTITPDFVNMLGRLSREAMNDIDKLPRGSQPLWFRSVVNQSEAA